MPTMTVPSNLLRKNNLEILLTSFASLTSQPDSPITPPSSLVPTTAIPTSASGRHTLVAYPVHKSLSIISLQDLVKRTRPVGVVGNSDVAQLVQSVLISVDATKTFQEAELRDLGLLGMVDLAQAEDGLKAFRRSMENAIVYEHAWTSSGLPTVTRFLSTKGDEPRHRMNYVVQALISSLLLDARRTLDVQELESDCALVDVDAASIEDKLALNAAVTTWAERSHTELRDALDLAFSSPQWHRLKWWKLFWRVDDVTMMLSDILDKRWLNRAEKESILLAGRLQQAGLAATEAAPLGLSEETNHQDRDIGVGVTPRIPQRIEQARTGIATTTILPLQSLAQRLVFTSLSVTGLTTALSAFVYVSVSTTSIYESATVAALGAVFSLRHLQKKWERARAFWQGELREEGRKTLRGTEQAMRTALNTQAAPAEEALDSLMRNEARQSVERAIKALTKLAT